MIKAIESEYKGYRFRSRLEARWAIFFDHLGIQWEYEPEGFLLPDGTHYLPDFWLPDMNWIVEIKPRPIDFDGQPWIPSGTKEGKFLSALCPDTEDGDDPMELPAPFTNAGFIVLYGQPGPVGDLYGSSGSRASYAGSVGYDSPYLMCECEGCGALGFQFDGRDGRNKHKPKCPAAAAPYAPDKGSYNFDSPRILKAADAARRARFEHRKAGVCK